MKLEVLFYFSIWVLGCCITRLALYHDHNDHMYSLTSLAQFAGHIAGEYAIFLPVEMAISQSSTLETRFRLRDFPANAASTPPEAKIIGVLSSSRSRGSPTHSNLDFSTIVSES